MKTMALYAESGGHVAKRPRIDFHSHTTSGGDIHDRILGAGSPTTIQISAGAAGGNQAGILSPQYIEQQLSRRSQEPEKPNHILLFTVLNPTYPITCEVLHTICSPLGTVLRIVIFKKNGVQAMVEFDGMETAKSAKDGLHGCDIYSGCCTLKVEYAKPTKLNVYKNDLDSWDYTNPNLGKERNDAPVSPATPVPSRPVLLKTVNSDGFENGFGSATGATTPVTQHQIAAATLAGLDGLPQGGSSLNAAANMLEHARHHGAGGATLLTRGGAPILATPIGLAQSTAGTLAGVAATAAAGTPTYQHQGSVCMVYGLNSDKMNANRIFNLFCLYGNVVRVKFLKTKEGCAMVQMGDALAVERVVSNLNNTAFFGAKMQLGFSKQAFLADVQAPYQLADGTPSFQDFMGSKNNRFINPEMASKNRIQPPSKILHFFNTPPGLEAEDVEVLFTDHGSPKPKCVKLFPSKTERSSSGLIEFETLGDALEALVSCNHQPVQNPNGKFPYIMKLCFSSSRSIPATIRERV